jgi:hypothetical protein
MAYMFQKMSYDMTMEHKALNTKIMSQEQEIAHLKSLLHTATSNNTALVPSSGML